MKLRQGLMVTANYLNSISKNRHNEEQLWAWTSISETERVALKLSEQIWSIRSIKLRQGPTVTANYLNSIPKKGVTKSSSETEGAALKLSKQLGRVALSGCGGCCWPWRVHRGTWWQGPAVPQLSADNTQSDGNLHIFSRYFHPLLLGETIRQRNMKTSEDGSMIREKLILQ